MDDAWWNISVLPEGPGSARNSAPAGCQKIVQIILPSQGCWQ